MWIRRIEVRHCGGDRRRDGGPAAGPKRPARSQRARQVDAARSPTRRVPVACHVFLGECAAGLERPGAARGPCDVRGRRRPGVAHSQDIFRRQRWQGVPRRVPATAITSTPMHGAARSTAGCRGSCVGASRPPAVAAVAACRRPLSPRRCCPIRAMSRPSLSRASLPTPTPLAAIG